MVERSDSIRSVGFEGAYRLRLPSRNVYPWYHYCLIRHKISSRRFVLWKCDEGWSVGEPQLVGVVAVRRFGMLGSETAMLVAHCLTGVARFFRRSGPFRASSAGQEGRQEVG
jgi:hypothetical protein